MNRTQKRRLCQWTAMVLSLCLIFALSPSSWAKDVPPLLPVLPGEPGGIVEAPVSLTAEADEFGDIHLAWEYPDWEHVPYGYELYRSIGPEEEFLLLGKPNQPCYTDGTAKAGIVYYYKVRACRYGFLPYEQDGIVFWEWGKVYGEFSKAVKITILIGDTAVTLTPVDEKTVKVQWEPAAWATGYSIERKLKSGTKYKVVADITKTGGGTYSDTKLTFGERYNYRVRAYRDVSETRVYGKYSSAKTVLVTMAAPKLKTIKLTKADTVQLSWEPVNKAQGYKVYRMNEEGVYKSIKTLTGKASCTADIKKLTNGVNYTYIVRAYTDAKTSRLYGLYSAPKSRLMDYYGYEYEPWEDKVYRIFKQDTPITFSSATQAWSEMKIVRIKVWSINSQGKKYTRNTSVTVHKNIAPTVEQIFKEIYEGKEKFPIKDVGAYNWRTNIYSEHCRGLAIDINTNENYMIKDGKIVAGSFWKPGENPYSIPADGEMVQIMRKYGFVWGGTWTSSKDYMHFSYFGG